MNEDTEACQEKNRQLPSEYKKCGAIARNTFKSIVIVVGGVWAQASSSARGLEVMFWYGRMQIRSHMKSWSLHSRGRV